MRVLSAIAIRAAEVGDVDVLLALCAEHAAYERIACSARREPLARAIASSRLHAFVAEADHEVVGYATATVDFSTLSAAAFLHMDCLYVREEWRGHRLGQQLVDRVVAIGRSLGCENVQWQTPTWNEGAIRFYLRRGAARLDKARFTLAL